MKRIFSILFALALMLPAWGIDIYKYKLPEVKADFVEKYSEVTNENLDQFFADWEQWSATYGASKIDNNFDALFQCFFNDVRKEAAKSKERIDVGFKYEVLPCLVAQFHSPDSLSKIIKTNKWDILDSVNIDKVTEQIPHLDGNRKVLYLTKDINNLLNDYLTKNSVPKKQRFNKVPKKIRKLIYIHGMHWGNGWWVQSMPIANKIVMSQHGYLIAFRDSWCGGAEWFYPENGKREEVVNWME